MKVSANFKNKPQDYNRIVIILLLAGSFLVCLAFPPFTEKQFAAKHLTPQPTAVPKDKDEPEIEEFDDEENDEEIETSPPPPEKKRVGEEMEEVTVQDEIEEFRLSLGLTELGERGFHLKRERINSDEQFLKFLKNVGKKFNFEEFAGKEIKPEIEQARIELIKKELGENREFLNSRWITKFLERKINKPADAIERRREFRGFIAVELVRRKLSEEFPENQGFRVMVDVDLHYRANNGKLLNKVTDIDVIVFQTTETPGRLKIIRLEQIKSGENDANRKADETGAEDQMDWSVKAMLATKRVPVVLVYEGKLLDVDFDTFAEDFITPDNSKTNQITRGLPGKQGFKENLEFTLGQLNDIAKAMIKRCIELKKAPPSPFDDH